MPRNNDSVSLYVSGFRDSTRPSDLASIFEPHGRILDVYIPKDYYTRAPRGFAYIQYEDEEVARRVYESNEEFILDGRKLDIQYAQGRRKSPHQMMRRDGSRRRSRSRDRFYRPSSRCYSRSRSRSRDRRRYSRDSRSRSSRYRSPSPRRRSPSPRHSSPHSPRRRSSYSPRRRSPYSPKSNSPSSPRSRPSSPRDRTPPPDDRKGVVTEDRSPLKMTDYVDYSPHRGGGNRPYTPSPERAGY